jgi:hypothetical protein
MNFRALSLTVLLVAAAFTVGRALVTHEEVGALEWVAGLVLILGLAFLALRMSRRPAQRG